MKPWALCLTLLLLCWSCSPNSPREAAEGYLSALARMDFDGAAHYVADEGRSNFEYLKKLYADLKPEEQQKFQVKDWKVTGESTSGDTATIDFVFDGSKKGQMTIRKVSGVWKVDHRSTF